MKLIGWLGSIMLAICTAPQAWQSYVTKSSEGISLQFLLLWLGGEILTLIYVFPKKDYPLIMNYILNIFLICVILRYIP